MRVVIVAASGRCGRSVVAHALAAGHDVVAVVRRAGSSPEGCTEAVADARDPDALAAAVDGADAVVSCLGQTGTPPDRTVLTDGAATILGSMKATGTRRLVVVSAAAALVAGDDPLSRFVAKPLVARFVASTADTRTMEGVVRSSDTEWTLLRPSRLVGGRGSADYRRGVDRAVRWHYSTCVDTVGRAAVHALSTPAWVGHGVFITG